MTSDDAEGPVTPQACLLLLCRPGERPDAAEIRTVLQRASLGYVSHDPAALVAPEDDASDWLELLVDGLTFDLLGLAPGHPLHGPPVRHCFGVAPHEIESCEAIGLAPGPHLSGAHNALPVVRTLLRVGAALASNCKAVLAAAWTPAASAMGRAYLIDIVASWAAGGPFPALGLIGVEAVSDGTLRSEGLAFFADREIVVPSGLTADRVAATRLLLRLVDRLVEQGATEGVDAVTLTDGTRLQLVPDGPILRVEPG